MNKYGVTISFILTTECELPDARKIANIIAKEMEISEYDIAMAEVEDIEQDEY